MTDGPGFAVRPDALRAVAAGLRDDAGRFVATGVAVDDAAVPVASAGGALGSAIRELSSAVDQATGASRKDLEALATSLGVTATEYAGSDRAGAAGFGALSARLPG